MPADTIHFDHGQRPPKTLFLLVFEAFSFNHIFGRKNMYTLIYTGVFFPHHRMSWWLLGTPGDLLWGCRGAPAILEAERVEHLQRSQHPRKWIVYAGKPTEVDHWTRRYQEMCRVWASNGMGRPRPGTSRIPFQRRDNVSSKGLRSVR